MKKKSRVSVLRTGVIVSERRSLGSLAFSLSPESLLGRAFARDLLVYSNYITGDVQSEGQHG